MTTSNLEITSAELRDICIAAINAACVSRGKRKGQLLARAMDRDRLQLELLGVW